MNEHRATLKCHGIEQERPSHVVLVPLCLPPDKLTVLACAQFERSSPWKKQVPIVSKPAVQFGDDLQRSVEVVYVARWLASLHRKVGGVVTTRRVSIASPARVTAAPGGEADRLHQVQLSACSWMSCCWVGQASSGMLRLSRASWRGRHSPVSLG
jgi:hypothetical protein